VNPELVKGEGEQIGLEGCLSVPGYVGEVKRYLRVVARGLNRHGKQVKVKGDDLLARAIQHEIDHLDGILFTDRLTSLETLRKVEPQEEEQKAELVGA
jgi:peptide deformylase